MAYLGIQIPICTVHVQLCDRSVSNPFVTPTHSGTTCVNMVNILQNECICVSKDIVDVKQLLD